MNDFPTDYDKMTRDQARDWPGAVATINAALADSYGSVPEHPGYWKIDWAEEIRPGRGHQINARFLDGEVFAQIIMDVYGHPSHSVAQLDWIHASSDEECECAPCTSEREEDTAIR